MATTTDAGRGRDLFGEVLVLLTDVVPHVLAAALVIVVTTTTVAEDSSCSLHRRWRAR